MNVTTEAIRELSLSAAAKAVGCHPRIIREAFERGEIPAMYLTPGKQYRVPVWGLDEWQRSR